jgi:hypothetical protein
MNMILIAGSTGWYSASYKLAKKAAEGTDTILTSSFYKVSFAVKAGLAEKVIIIHGAPKKSAVETYKKLKALNSKIKFIVMDSWTWVVPKPDRAVLLPVASMVRSIRRYLK